MQSEINNLKLILTYIGLNEYQSSALSHLIYLGETKATDLSKVSGIPSARVYGVLEDLSKKGLVIIRPGRPLLYSSVSLDELSNALISDVKEENKHRLEVAESNIDRFEKTAESLFMKGSKVKVRTPLLRVVRLGEVSLEETRKLYRSAQNELLILTRAMEYLPNVEPELNEAASRNVNIKILMRSRKSLSESDVQKRNSMIKRINTIKGNIDVKISNEVLIRGCITDSIKGGKALFLVEEEGVPYYLREAAVTIHPGVVKGLADMFKLRWAYASSSPD